MQYCVIIHVNSLVLVKSVTRLIVVGALSYVVSCLTIGVLLRSIWVSGIVNPFGIVLRDLMCNDDFLLYKPPSMK